MQETLVKSETSIERNWRRHSKYGICLDAGCGSGPRRPADQFSAYIDVIKPRLGVELPEPYWCTGMEDLSMFADKTFDWVRSHHSLEHCVDPDKACAEMSRVGKAGIISTPPVQSCMMFGRKDHRWYVFHDRGRLLIIEKWHPSLGIPRSVTHSELNQNYYWEGQIKWQTVRVNGVGQWA